MPQMYKHTTDDCVYCSDAITDWPIATTVRYGSGRFEDVQTVQQLLNAVPAYDGGPTPLLKVDGICGPLTTSAINTYQSKKLGFSDGAVDPGGKTIRSLAAFVCDSPTVPYGAVSEEPPKQSAKPKSGKIGEATGTILIALAKAMMREMEPAISLLRWKMTRIDNTFTAFMNKHFATGKQTITSPEAGFVSTIVGDVHHYIARFNAFGKLPIDNVLLFDPNEAPDFVGRTVRGGDKMSTRQIQIYVDKGVVTKSPGQSIWLSYLWGKEAGPAKRLTLLHEMAHFVGPRDGSFAKVHDYSPRCDSGNFLTIPKFQKLHCAETLGLFMLEWCVGTDAIVGMPSLSLYAKHFGQYPRVDANHRVIAHA